MHILTREDAQYIDQVVPTAFDIPLELLMENAGRGLVDALWGNYDLLQLDENNMQGRFVLFLCGCGNNGADGLVAARHLMEQGVPVRVVLCGNPDKGSTLFQSQLKRCKTIGCSVEAYDDFNDWSQAVVVVEGLVGTGLEGALRSSTIEILHDIDIMRTQYGFAVWAIDVPAGLDATTGQISEGTLACDYTVTFGAMKQGLLLYPGKNVGGVCIVAPLGVPWQQMIVDRYQTFTIDNELAELLIEYRPDTAHKGVNGNLLIIGGSGDMVGAPMLAGEAAVHSGAGKTTLAVPEKIQKIVQGRIIPEVMVTSITADISGLCHQRNVVAIGPGLGRTDEVKTLVQSVLTMCDNPLVIDADALYAMGHIGIVNQDAVVSGDLNKLYSVSKSIPSCVMTPHLGEFSRLINMPVKWIERNYVIVARAFAMAHNVVLVLKGIPSLVALPDGTVYINTIGNSGMGTGGMGDVLTGVISAFISQGYSLQDSAVLGVYVHSRSADLLFDNRPWGYTPSDVSLHIGQVIGELLGERE
ncbi:NAD(P)H-hydrate dehydratase [Veillonella denticariosi]|uniref:NAD(P)H-hydrate dehydratase n=1 Tax=Veillonella denticariosi TaxID=419208 RepID=UPI002492A933|nr:NAD(P)H-hydrate dehydratase [Veillonella denticariosi]